MILVYGNYFLVEPAVLIPRPETEELVDLIIKDNPSGSLLDIGCGSGIIPISIKLNRPLIDAHGLDISAAAISVSKLNASQLNCSINWHQKDVLSDNFEIQNFDIIVSNPPYVLESDKIVMQESVLEHEPDIALFVPDDKPLLFYKRIVEFSLTHLNDNGKLYFEIHEEFGSQVKELLVENQFKEVTIIQDLQGKDRIVRGYK